jgi:Protein of unknown function (DUF732)
VKGQDKPIRGITKTFAVTVFALGMGIAVAAPAAAQPDEEGYLFDMRSDGFTGPDSEMLDWGYRACDDWRDGINRDVIIDNIYENTDESISREDATFLFDSATFYLC